MNDAFAEKRVIEPVHEEIYRGFPLEVYAFGLSVHCFIVRNSFLLTIKRLGGFLSVQAAMRAGRELIDELIKEETPTA